MEKKTSLNLVCLLSPDNVNYDTNETCYALFTDICNTCVGLLYCVTADGKTIQIGEI